MVAQFLDKRVEIYDFQEYVNNKKKRKRAKYPSYVKFFSIYEYDRKKFKKLIDEYFSKNEKQKKIKLLKNLNPHEILNECYLKDKNGKRIRDVGERHIYRLKTLYLLYHEIGRIIFKGQLKLDLEE